MNQMMEKWKTWIKSGGRRQAGIWFAKFMLLMLAGTFVSRGIYAYSLPRITMDTARTMSLSHVVEVDGEIEKGMETAVNTLSDVRVKEVYVSEGQMVVSGNELFSLDLEDLQEKIDSQKTAIEKLNLQIAALRKNEQLAAAEKAEKLKRANEDYALGITDADREIKSAGAELAGANARKGELAGKDDYIADAIDADSQVQTEKSSLETLKKELKALQKELKEITDQVSENDTRREELEAKIKAKKAEISETEDAVEIAKKAAAHTAEETWKSKNESLSDTVTSKTKSYEDTVQKEKEAVLTAGRAVEDAGKQTTADSTRETSQLEAEELQKKLKKYQELLAGGGVITSSQEGMITKVSVSPGDPIGEHAAMLLAASDEKLKFTAEITKEQQKYISTGDPVEISFDSGKHVISDAVVQSMEKSTTKTDTYRITVLVPAKGLTIGKTGTLKCMKQTENYPICVPLDAMHADGSQFYVLLVSESESILGTELTAVRRDVTIRDQNDKYAALDESCGISEEKMIVTTTKEITAGDKVRPVEK